MTSFYPGERILTGQSKLSLSTGCLSMLSEGFKAIRDEETGNETFEVLPSNSHRLPEIISLQFLYDFIQKTKAFKVGLDTFVLVTCRVFLSDLTSVLWPCNRPGVEVLGTRVLMHSSTFLKYSYSYNLWVMYSYSYSMYSDFTSSL